MLTITASRLIVLISLSCKNTKFLLVADVCIAIYFVYSSSIILSSFSADIKVMECLSRTFEVKTVPLQVPYLGPEVSLHSFHYTCICFIVSLFFLKLSTTRINVEQIIA